MKLIQCNIQGRRHIDKVTNLLQLHQPDVVCLQEADKQMISILHANGYMTRFLPIVKRQVLEGLEDEGVVLASKVMQNIEEYYYYLPSDGVVLQRRSSRRETTAQGYIIADCVVGGVVYRVCTTHFTWTAKGAVPNSYQKVDIQLLLNKLSAQTAHILCGDFNIPRDISPLYDVLCEQYVDNVPTRYASSLDKRHHRLGTVTSRSHLFTRFMVDYIFTQTLYEAKDVELIFDVSDHAAIVADISRSD